MNSSEPPFFSASCGDEGDRTATTEDRASALEHALEAIVLLEVSADEFDNLLSLGEAKQIARSALRHNRF